LCFQPDTKSRRHFAAAAVEIWPEKKDSFPVNVGRLRVDSTLNQLLQMPVVLKIDPQRQVVYSAFYGKLSEEEVVGHGRLIAADPDFKPHFSEIVDFSAVTEADISDATLGALAANPSLYDDSVLHIVVAPADSLFKIASKYKQLSRTSRPNLFVVRTRAEAYQLLPNASGRK
jgi:hypothetical protein